MPEMGVQVIPVDFKGPLPENTMGLLLGRSSSALKGLMIVPGVIDQDYTGEIKVLASSPQGIISISPGDRIAQLCILPSLHGSFPSQQRFRGDKGMGSTGIDLACLTMELKNRPMLELIVKGKIINGLLDTGADTSIIAEKDWPKDWPTQKANQTLRGLGIATEPKKSSMWLQWKSPEGQEGLFQPYVLEQIPVTLWGRDILNQMGMKITTEGIYSEQAQNIMKKQGHKWGKGLGINEQGITEPISIKQKGDRQGLGFSSGPLMK